MNLLLEPTNARVPLDFYETPAWQTRALTRHVQIAGRCYEPCVGNGAIIRAMEGDGVERSWATNDIDTNWPADTHHDATADLAWRLSRPADWVVSNFPFAVATGIVKQAHREARVGVAVLLRLSWLEPTADRRDFLVEHPPDLLIVLPRTRYNPRSNKTDSVTTAWMVWYIARKDHASRAPTGIIVHPVKS